MKYLLHLKNSRTFSRTFKIQGLFQGPSKFKDFFKDLQNSRTFSRTFKIQGLFKYFSRTIEFQGLFKDRKNPEHNQGKRNRQTDGQTDRQTLNINPFEKSMKNRFTVRTVAMIEKTRKVVLFLMPTLMTGIV